MVCTDCVCSGAQRAPWAVANMEAFPANVQCLQVCHCEAPKGPWQSRSTRPDHRKAAAKTQLPARDCTPRALPRASRSGRHVGLRPPRNDKSVCLAPLNYCCNTRNCLRRSGSAATDAIGAHHVNDSLYQFAGADRRQPERGPFCQSCRALRRRLNQMQMPPSDRMGAFFARISKAACSGAP